MKYPLVYTVNKLNNSDITRPLSSVFVVESAWCVVPEFARVEIYIITTWQLFYYYSVVPATYEVTYFNGERSTLNSRKMTLSVKGRISLTNAL